MDTDLPLVQCRHHHHLQSKATPPAVLFLCSSLNGRRGHGIMLIHENVCFIPFIQIDNPVKTQEKLQLVLTEALIVTYAARWSHDKLIRRVVQTDVQILWFHAVDATVLQVNVNRAKVKRLEEKVFFSLRVSLWGSDTIVVSDLSPPDIPSSTPHGSRQRPGDLCCYCVKILKNT